MAANKQKRLVRFEITRSMGSGKFYLQVRAKNRSIVFSSSRLKRKPTRLLKKFLTDLEKGDFEVLDFSKPKEKGARTC